MNGSLDELYFDYLYDCVGLPKRGRNRTYFKLLRQLHSKDFVWLMMKDDNREAEGKDIRWEFVNNSNLKQVPADWMYLPCSLLEMMLAVSRRLSFLTDGDPREWFLQLLHNLNLGSYSDLSYDGYIQIIDEKLEKLIWRKYASNGEGGMFPLKNPATDQRETEIWNQMNAWLIERSRREG